MNPSDDSSIPARFAAAVARHGDRMAVRTTNGGWTYTELDRRAGWIAAEILRERGECSKPVALLFEHAAPAVAAILGVLKANKMYVALDAGHPPGQIRAMLESSGAKLLLADQSNLELAKSFASENLKLVPVTEEFFAGSGPDDFPGVSATAGAWLMFTSGSTDAPKGVWQSHAGLVHEAEVYAELAGIAPGDRVSLVAALGLAASGGTLYGTLLAGGTLGLFPLRAQGVERLAEWLAHEEINIFHTVPTVFRHLARTTKAKTAFAKMKLIRLGGEPVLRADLEDFQKLCPDDCRFMQSLSSTETGMIATFTMDKKTILPGPRVPVGRAVRNVEIFLVDESHSPLINGGEGKIAVCSPRLRQGYWKQPELTAEKFLPDARHPDARIFISNDLGRFLPDGTLEHLGRADQLVKIRGQRVDLGEVEAAMLASGLAREAVVVALENDSGDKKLVAYFVSRDDATTLPQRFRDALRLQVPEYMIPAGFVPLEKLPLTPAGKVDRRALQAIKPDAPKKELGRSERPRDVIEIKLQRIWETALKFSPIGRTDDFYEIGGSSLSAVETTLAMEEAFNVTLHPAIIAENSTIEKLGAAIAGDFLSSGGPLVKMQAGAGRPVFFIHSGQGDATTYGLLARRLPGRMIYAFQAIGLTGDAWPLTSVEAMADRYLPEILAADPDGPYLLGGACIGSMVSLELAHRLLARGKKVALLAMFDGRMPQRIAKDVKLARRIYLTIRWPVHEGWRVTRWWLAYALGLSRRRRWLPSWRKFIRHIHANAYRHYRPAAYPGEMTLFITTETYYGKYDARMALKEWAANKQVINITGHRDGLFARPTVDELARELRAAIAQAEGG